MIQIDKAIIYDYDILKMFDVLVGDISKIILYLNYPGIFSW